MNKGYSIRGKNMWKSTRLFEEDLKLLGANDKIKWNELSNKTILITGATGLIGYTLTYLNEVMKLNIQIYLLVRNIKKAKMKISDNSVRFIEGTVENIPVMEADIDYVVHGASPTASSYFINYPVETIKTAVLGTINMLELAKKKKVRSFIFLSSMEIYGAPKTERKLKEEDVDYMDPLILRNCYPEGKRQCEALCKAYYEEYNVPAKCVRLAQTFGPGVDKEDCRVFAEFARCAMSAKDIVLLTKGESKRCYLYTMDAVSAILFTLLYGENGVSYNAANEKTYCSVLEMAQLVKEEIAKNKINVIISENSEDQKKYPPAHFYNLDTKRLKNLGWSTTKDLKEMYIRMIDAM